jgi:hypothetical protein
MQISIDFKGGSRNDRINDTQSTSNLQDADMQKPVMPFTVGKDGRLKSNNYFQLFHKPFERGRY